MEEDKSQDQENNEEVIRVLFRLIRQTEEMERQIENALRRRAKKKAESSKE